MINDNNEIEKAKVILPEVLDSRDTENRQKKEEINLEIAREEYQRQSEAFTTVETKASYLLIILTGIFAAFTLSNLSFETNLLAIKVIHIILVASIAVLLFVIFIFTLNVIVSRKIFKYDLNNFDKPQKDKSYTWHLERIMVTFRRDVQANEKVLRHKHKYFKLASKLLIIVVSVFLIDFLLIFITSLL